MGDRGKLFLMGTIRKGLSEEVMVELTGMKQETALSGFRGESVHSFFTEPLSITR